MPESVVNNVIVLLTRLLLHTDEEYTYPFLSCTKAKIHLSIKLALKAKMIAIQNNLRSSAVSVEVFGLIALHSS